jgi:hypothetical protein
VIDDKEVRPARRLRNPRAAQRPPAGESGPPWLPADGDKQWGPNMWAAIVALHKRYPGALAKLEHDWHERPERTETFAALAIWRASIDVAAEDPREELAFHNAIQIQQLARILDQTPGIGRPLSRKRRCPIGGDTGACSQRQVRLSCFSLPRGEPSRCSLFASVSVVV